MFDYLLALCAADPGLCVMLVIIAVSLIATGERDGN
jgi:hypothetical protein